MTRVLILALLLGSVAPLDAAERPLPGLVGAEVGLCVSWTGTEGKPLVVPEPLAVRLTEWPMFREWQAGPQYRNLRATLRALEQQLDQPAGSFFRDLVSGGVLLAAYPRAKGEPTTVLLFRAATAEVLAKAVSVWNDGEHAQTAAIPLGSQTYFRRTTGAANGATQFYVILGNVFAITDDEETLRDVVRRASSAGDGGLLTTDRYRQALALLPGDCRAIAYFNPRAWDAAVKPPESPDPAEAALFKLWQQCQAVVVGLRAGPGVAVEAVVQFDSTGELPWQGYAVRTAGAAAFLDAVPDDVLFVLAGRVSFEGLGQVIADGLPPANRQQWQNLRQVARGLFLGQDVFDDVLPILGPNWGAYVVPRPDAPEGTLPVDGLLAIELAQATTEDAIEVRKALDSALTTGFGIVAAVYGAHPAGGAATLESADRAGATTRWVDSVGPFQPTFALTQQHLAFATRPEVVEQFVQASEGQGLADAPGLRAWQSRFFPDANQLILVNLRELRKLAVAKRSELVERAAASSELTSDEVGRRFDRLLGIAELFDGLFAAAEFRPHHLRVVIGGGVVPTE